MGKRSTGSWSESRPEWDQLEDWVRGQVQELIQELLEEEVTEFLGRAKSARRSESDNETGYRNGYGRPRRLTLSSGTVQLRRPRVRNTEEEFESRLLPLFVNRTRKVAELIPQLYLHGLSEGDFDLAVRGLLGEEAPISASTVARLKDKWNDELAQWRARPLDDLEVVYMWVDGVYVKAGLEREKAAILVVMAALSDGRKVVVSAIPGYREDTDASTSVSSFFVTTIILRNRFIYQPLDRRNTANCRLSLTRHRQPGRNYICNPAPEVPELRIQPPLTAATSPSNNASGPRTSSVWVVGVSGMFYGSTAGPFLYQNSPQLSYFSGVGYLQASGLDALGVSIKLL